MKQIAFIFFAFGIYACASKSEKTTTTNTGSIIQEEIRPGVVLEDIPTGIWSLISYIDSAVITKSIYPHSFSCASYGYQFQFDEQNPSIIKFVGYHESFDLPLKKKKGEYLAKDDVLSYTITFNEDFTKATLLENDDKNTFTFRRTDKNIEDIGQYFN